MNKFNLINKQVRIITLVIFKNGRRIHTEYKGKFIEDNLNYITLLELDGTTVSIRVKDIKRIEEIK